MRKDQTPIFYWIFAIGCILFGIMSIVYPIASHTKLELLHFIIMAVWFALAYRELYCYYIYFVKPRRENSTQEESKSDSRDGEEPAAESETDMTRTFKYKP